jgi:hypothetical protein
VYIVLYSYPNGTNDIRKENTITHAINAMMMPRAHKLSFMMFAPV